MTKPISYPNTSNGRLPRHLADSHLSQWKTAKSRDNSKYCPAVADWLGSSSNSQGPLELLTKIKVQLDSNRATRKWRPLKNNERSHVHTVKKNQNPHTVALVLHSTDKYPKKV